MLINPSFAAAGHYECPAVSFTEGATHASSIDNWFETWRKLFPCLPPIRQSPKNKSSFTTDHRLSLSSPLPFSLLGHPTTSGMPYTPPSYRSPASSAPSSPSVSRRSSFHGTTPTSPSASSRPALPRSASYLTKHRRTPSVSAGSGAASTISANGSTPDITPPGTSDDLKGMADAAAIATAAAQFNAGPVRQSPPPITDGRSMPAGAIISPPDSQTSSEDEGASADDARGREIENLRELQDAISAIPQHRASSPDRTSSPGDLLVLPSQIEEMVDASHHQHHKAPPGHRRISHMRSNTEPNIFVSKSADATPTASEEDSEMDEPAHKPQMVRKKSGELVRPALRPASQRRPSSMPGTPTFSKAVHFDSHLEHVRHFLQVDRPLAVSAGSSPADNYESDTEYPFNADKSGTRSPPFEWETVINSFPVDTPLRKSQPIRVERIWMSPDQKSLLGSIAVANMAFQKSVTCRFTFDYWKTVSEVAAEYSHEIRPRETEAGHDRFQFTIKLSDFANLEAKTLYFCVRYNVNGREYWDNNNDLNFQIDFRKKMLPQNGKKNFQGAGARPSHSLPRSNRRSNPSTSPRPKSLPAGVFDEFSSEHKMWDDGPIHEFLGEESAPIRLKRTSKSTTSLPSDNLANKLSAPVGLAFANRYDFGASLDAAKQAQKGSGGSPRGSPRSDGFYMKPHKKMSFAPPIQTQVANSTVKPPPVQVKEAVPSGPTLPTLPQLSGPPGSPASATIASASYEEIVNKYCFFNGSKQSSPQLKDGTIRNARFDGAGDDVVANQSSESSLASSPMMDKAQHGALRYAIHQNLNPYFQNTHVAIGASPAESPLGGIPATARQSSSPPTSGTSTVRSAMPGTLSPLAGTSTTAGGLGFDAVPFHHAQQMADRFPFSPEAHAATAIRG
ncbi:phosphatase regulatory subunit-domain-containing protein [Apiospora arundinis]|uniref:Phosphatase regulatory subunit-domain-containing protein n=1 Tax=Apiospora arundinis TaxID=335852 RepID=A0ABR2J407_9PEZI